MVGPDTDRKKSRAPTLDDVAALCKELNEHGVKYVLIGGFAVNYHGLERGTKDVDLLVDPSNENILKIREALSFLPDNAVKEVSPDDVEEYGTVRVIDEIVVDLLKKACDVTYKDAGINYGEFNGVAIPIADVQTMIKTKQTIRPQDKRDLAFLENKLRNSLSKKK